MIRTTEEYAVVSVTKLANLEPIFAFEFEHSGCYKSKAEGEEETYTHHFKRVKPLDKHARSLKEALV